MDKKMVHFGNTEIRKHKFYQNKNPTLIENVDINKIVVSNKVCFGKNNFK